MRYLWALVAYGPLERIHPYAAFGGVPKYLRPIHPRRRVGDNIIDLLLSPRERLEATQFPGYVGQHVVEDVVHDDDGFSKDPDRSTTTAGT
jgi:hypothetical protein